MALPLTLAGGVLLGLLWAAALSAFLLLKLGRAVFLHFFWPAPSPHPCLFAGGLPQKGGPAL